MHKKPKIKDYNAIVGHYMAYFIQKQWENDDVDYYWIADRIGEIVDINDFFFNFTDIKFDVDNDVEKGKIFEWYDYTLEQHYITPDKTVNYENYLKGARV